MKLGFWPGWIVLVYKPPTPRPVAERPFSLNGHRCECNSEHWLSEFCHDRDVVDGVFTPMHKRSATARSVGPPAHPNQPRAR